MALSTPEFVQSVIDEVDTLVGNIGTELGYLGSAIVASITYDTKWAFQEAVQLGKYAADTFIALTKQALGDYWLTVKAQLSTAWDQLKGIASLQGFQAAVDYATTLLSNIDWRAVSVSLTGIAEATLATTARAVLAMFVSGVLGTV
jgi:hypothetical protein